MTKQIVRNDRTNQTMSNHDFAAKDSKGRAIGARVWTFEVSFEEKEVEDTWGRWNPEMLGHHFCLEVWATRDRQTFGAVQRTRYFRTAEERDAAMIKYLRAAQKRADKVRAAQQREDENAEIESLSALNDDSYDPPVA